MGLHAKYLETSRASKASWAARNRDRINAKRRERRLKARAEKLSDKNCLNCEMMLTVRLNWSPGRSYLYCRKCLTEHREEVRRHRWRRYYNRKNGITPKRIRETFIVPLKSHPPMNEEPTAPKTISKEFTIRVRVSKTTQTPISTCPCGNKYLKTRRGQNTCLPCIAYGDKSMAR